MITIIATIQPVHINNIRTGLKTVEIRKSAPKELPFRVLCCESGSGGKITCEFIVSDVRKDRGSKEEREKAAVMGAHISQMACVPWEWICKYAGDKSFYLWHISNVIDYCTAKGHRVRNISEFGIKRPPQSWQYVGEEYL